MRLTRAESEGNEIGGLEAEDVSLSDAGLTPGATMRLVVVNEPEEPLGGVS